MRRTTPGSRTTKRPRAASHRTGFDTCHRRSIGVSAARRGTIATAVQGLRSKHRPCWESVHVAVDDYSRLACVEILPNERGPNWVLFLEHAVAWFVERGITVTEILTDNGPGYLAKAFNGACAHHHIRHLRPRRYRPRTNGKAERFIQTILREWAYGVTYRTSQQRALALQPWLDYSNHRRPHGALSHRPPATRLPAA